jgi:hypothetical protein
MKLGKGTLITLAVVVAVAVLAVAFMLLPKSGGGEGSGEATVEVSADAYNQGVADIDAVQKNLLAARTEVMAQMHEIIVAKGNDEEAILADPEWRRLEAMLARLNADYEATRLDMVNFRKTRVVKGATNAEEVSK